MRRPLNTAGFALVLILLAVGFAASEANDSAKASGSTPAVGEKRIPLRVLSWDETRKLVAAQKGKVVVLDLWSTYCAPCIREFPNLVKLQQQHGNDIACISLNLNYAGLKDEPPESFHAEVLEFLRKHGAEFPNVICKDPDLQVFEAIDLASIPAVYVYDRQGKLVKRFDNDDLQSPQDEFTYEKDVVPFVRKLLAKK